jgi:ABC-type uncharacterized transport system permease subunit
MDVPDVSLAVDMIVGAALSAIHALSTRTVRRDYIDNVALHILVGLGVSRAAARKLAGAPINGIELPEDSLLARTQPVSSSMERRASSV